jgi:hypothetical protein
MGAAIMRQLSLSIVATAVLAVAVPGAALGQDPGADKIPPPHPILTHIDKTPLVELSDGGGGLPYLGSPTAYNAGDWENALRLFHDSGVYNTELTQIDKIADAWLLRFVHAGAHERAHGNRKELRGRKPAVKHSHGRRARGATLHGRKLAIVLDIDETSLSNYSAIDADNFTFGPNSQGEPCASRRPRTSRRRASPTGPG